MYLPLQDKFKSFGEVLVAFNYLLFEDRQNLPNSLTLPSPELPDALKNAKLPSTI